MSLSKQTGKQRIQEATIDDAEEDESEEDVEVDMVRTRGGEGGCWKEGEQKSTEILL